MEKYVFKIIDGNLYCIIEKFNSDLNKYCEFKKYRYKDLSSTFFYILDNNSLSNFKSNDQMFSFKINDDVDVCIYDYINVFKNNDFFNAADLLLKRKKFEDLRSSFCSSSRKVLSTCLAFCCTSNIINFSDLKKNLNEYDTLYSRSALNNNFRYNNLLVNSDYLSLDYFKDEVSFNFLKSRLFKLKNDIINQSSNVDNDDLYNERLFQIFENARSVFDVNYEINSSLNFNCNDFNFLNDSFDFKFDSFYTKEKMIEEFSNLYFMDYSFVENLYNNNIDEIENSDNPKKTFIIIVKDAFYSSNIDKNPIVSLKSSSEKEDYIIHMAKDIYDVEDKELLALILAIHRLETGNGTSRRCIYDNNLGGIKDCNGFLTFKTFEIGAECFVRNVTKIVNEAYASSNYNYNVPIEYNIQDVYFDSSWGAQINPIKESILNNNELDKYFDGKYLILN